MDVGIRAVIIGHVDVAHCRVTASKKADVDAEITGFLCH
nr:MAG TPA: hypothetical protein [Caudoviricetes sp.]